MLSLLNGRVVAAATVAGGGEVEAVVGVFETLRLWAGRAQLFDEHYERFLRGCAHFGLAGVPHRGTLLAAITGLAQSNALADGVVRWSRWRDAAGAEQWQLEVTPPRDHMGKRAWRAKTVEERLPAPDAHTSCKHLGRRGQYAALRSARSQGWDELILGDQAGRVVEGAGSNVFWVMNGALATPTLAGGALSGVTQAVVMALAAGLGLQAGESTISLGDLRGAEEVFVTNALIGVRPLQALDNANLFWPGPVTVRLQSAWRARFGWC